jgi:hypothetical protein
MKQKNKKIISIDEFLDKDFKKHQFEEKYKNSLVQARATNNDANNIEKLNIRTGYYSLKTRIIKNPWVNEKPSTKATQWLFKEVFKNPKDFRYSRRLLGQGQLFMFEYTNPKYKDTNVLPWFDQYPLVISLGPTVTRLGVRNIGFNLHLLPPKIRIVALCSIFELFKRIYRYQVFLKQNQPVQINYKQIISYLNNYGIKFCVRMYIPSRMKQIVLFPLKTWHKAVFIPSRSYYGIRAKKLIEAWKTYCRNQGFSSSENIDWKSII